MFRRLSFHRDKRFFKDCEVEEMICLWVDGVPAPTPAIMKFGIYRNSASDAGRVQDGNDTMYTNVTSKKMTINFSWTGCDGEETAKILQQFDPEYVFLKFRNPKTNKIETKEFYTGDIDVPVWRILEDDVVYENISFKVIER